MPTDIKSDAVALLNALTQVINNGNALSVVVAIKKAENALNEVRSSVIAEANAEYLALKDKDPQAKVIIYDGAMLTKYTPRAVYEYPPHITEMETKLKALKKAAEADGSAKKLEVKQKEGSTLFSIKV